MSDTKPPCEPCQTINLANPDHYPKPSMEMYEKPHCSVKNKSPYFPELPVNATCIKVCTKEEYKMHRAGKKLAPPIKPYVPAHGKITYLAKAGILVGTMYFTYHQGVWGDQLQTTECWARWKEYMKSLNSRRPPTFDNCGNVVRQDIGGSLVAPFYEIYKEFITTCFSGVVKVPALIKCSYIEYLAALERSKDELDRQRKLKK